MKLRKAKSSDKKDLMKLVKGLYGRSSTQSVKDWEKYHSKYMKNAVLAQENNQVIAYIAFNLRKNYVYIGDLYVLPKHRKKGVASKLLKFVENYSKKVKRDLRVDVRKKDRPAKRFYEKHKFIYFSNKNKGSIKLIKVLK